MHRPHRPIWVIPTWAIFALVFSIASKSLTLTAQADQPTPVPLQDGNRIVFLGGTFVERAQLYGEIERLITTRFADKQLTFRNLGWSGDTVFAASRGIFDPPSVGYQRLIEQLTTLQPDVVFLGYGANEAFEGQPGLERFLAQFRKLRDDIAKLSCRVIVLSPVLQHRRPAPLPDPTPHNADLTLYSRALQSVCQETGDAFVDLLVPWTPRDPPQTADPLYDPNGLHLTQAGYRAVSERIERTLWPTEPSWSLHLSADGTVIASKGVTATSGSDKTFQVGGSLDWKLTDDRLVDWRQVKRTRQLRISGLPPGNYAWMAGEQTLASANAADWERGQAIRTDPRDLARAEQLREEICRKNRLYFYAWRPQNVTYLFGFRKHEQGQNAAEIGQFAPLITAVENRIHQLQQPETRTYRLVTVKERP